jgi:hypothetical protein
MIGNQDQLSMLQALLKQKKSKTFYATRLGITEIEVDELLKELRGEEPNDPLKAPLLCESVKKVNVEKGTIESTLILDFEPKDDIELAALHKINLDKYVITNYWSKVLPNGKFTSSVFSKRKEAKDYTPEDFAKFLENYTPNYIPEPKHTSDHIEQKMVDVELSISDYHLAKRHIDGDNSVWTRCARYYTTATTLISNVTSLYDIDTIVFPISNDFFHTDNYQHQTTNGTPQDTIMDYADEYEQGFNLLVDTIKAISRVCENVKVVLVQGNHDRTKSYYLAHALDVFFKNDPSVSFIREHSTVKGVMVGETFIGYHHGNCKIEDLPLLFATHPEYSQMFGYAKYREVHTGDKHHYMAKEVKGVRIQQMPSLSGTDRWHLDNNYVHSVRAALALVYNKDTGKIAEFEERI